MQTKRGAVKKMSAVGWVRFAVPSEEPAVGSNMKENLMAKSMTKSELAAHLADKVGISKKQVAAFFQAQADVAYKQAKNSFVIPGIGKLVLAKSAPREMVMRFGPKAGQTVKVPAKTRVKFRVAKAAKDAILGIKK